MLLPDQVPFQLPSAYAGQAPDAPPIKRPWESPDILGKLDAMCAAALLAASCLCTRYPAVHSSLLHIM